MKKGLRGGLFSLIPNRGVEDADEVLDDLEEDEDLDDEFDDELEDEVEELPEDKAEEVRSQSVQVGVVAEDSKVDEVAQAAAVEDAPQEWEEDVEEEVELEPMPNKPNVTPLTINFTKQEKVDATEQVREEIREKAKAVVDEDTAEGDKWDLHEEDVQHLRVEDIAVNPGQPRREFDEVAMQELTDSIAKHGILQPLVVSRQADDSYELVAGERRLRAAKSLGWERVPCVVRRNVTSGASQLELALIENIQRKDLNPIEEAMAYRQLNEEYGMTHEEIGERVGKSRVGVTNMIRILQLPKEIQRGLGDGKISSGHARAILMIPDEHKQIRFYRHLVDEGLTVRKAETRARRIQRSMELDDPMRRKRRGRSNYEIKKSGELEDRFGYDAKVKFLDTKNRFEISFTCHSRDDLQELLGRLLGDAPLPDQSDTE